MRGEQPDIRHWVTTLLVPAKTQLSWSLGSRGACRHLEHVTRGGQNTARKMKALCFFSAIMKRNCNLIIVHCGGWDEDRLQTEETATWREMRSALSQEDEHDDTQSRHPAAVCSETWDSGTWDILLVTIITDCDTCRAGPGGKKMFRCSAPTTMVGPNWWHTPHCYSRVTRTEVLLLPLPHKLTLI